MRTVQAVRDRLNTPFALVTSEDLYFLLSVMDLMLEEINLVNNMCKYPPCEKAFGFFERELEESREEKSP